jgi:hypothetical protein
MAGDALIARTRLMIAVAAMLAVLLVVVLIQVTTERRECFKLCKAAGFADVRFTPKRRAEPAQCHCLTKEEEAQSSRVPVGTQIQLPTK